MHILMIECNPNGIAGIANALELGHDVTLVSVDPDFYLGVSPLAEAAYAHPKCQVIKSEQAFSIEDLTALARNLHAEKPVHGVTTYSEYHTVHTAAVAEALGLPGMSVEGARNARHKHLTRTTLDGTGVRQPRFAHVADPAEVEAAVREIGFPCVVKPSDGTASLHVLHLKDEQDLRDYLAELADVVDYGRGVVRIPDILIEEFVTGELISVESCVLGNGEVVNLGLTDRPLSGFPHFIEMGATYFSGHPLQDELFATTTRVLNELGVDFGFIHTEYLLSADGPVLCEVNGRLIGGIVPSLMQITSGVDPYLEVIRQALGERPELPFPGETTAGGHWFGAPVAGTVDAIGFDAIEELPGFHSALAYKKPGTPVTRLSRSNFDWIGHIIFTGADRAEVNKRCEAALDGIDLRMKVDVAR
ncbi:ATP-grasp domain-containing protein [Streptomyces pristinaespiralis]|jgi:cysteine synthase A|uniref:Cysteine synthase n=1 Tax=Streptomyces pristinaespiralis TaxID=38300 RepID=A0A0M4DT78_STRPR|nr:ATP-grasp domain-containing protein [Streptomyces pristinaespiralis]ALC21945.1 cysteine synthase [Streptomyces pristinaespiralis]QMU15393.1 ATP-grasp domain-containing protein [Streptomyces pristinaespiralis]